MSQPRLASPGLRRTVIRDKDRRFGIRLRLPLFRLALNFRSDLLYYP